MQSQPPEDSESTGSSVGTDDQSATSSQILQRSIPLVVRAEAHDNPRRTPCHQRSFSTSSSVWSDLEISDNSSVDSFGTGNIKKNTLPKADDKEKARQIQKALIKCAHISNEYVRLTELLETLPPNKIVDILEEKLHKKDSKAVVALSVLLPRSEFPPMTQVHCVRCHKNFDPKNNSQCFVSHPNSSVAKTSEDVNGAHFRCGSCRKEFHLAQMHFYNEHVNSYLAGFCFSGVHTTNPLQVAYRGAVKTCEEKGCVEFYV